MSALPALKDLICLGNPLRSENRDGCAYHAQHVLIKHDPDEAPLWSVLIPPDLICPVMTIVYREAARYPFARALLT
jgi:hypothetical protein